MMSDNLPQNSIQLVLNSVGYMVIGTITQQNDAFIQFTHRVQEKLGGARTSHIKAQTENYSIFIH